EPLVGEGVPEPVRVEVVDAGLGAPLLEDLRDPRRREPALAAKPEGGVAGAGVRAAGTDVAVEGVKGGVAHGHRSPTVALAVDIGNADLAVDVGEVEAGDLAQPCAGVGEEHEQGAVAPVVELAAGAGGE